ncbi:MAG: dihydrofolate reductase family protein [bacterium]
MAELHVYNSISLDGAFTDAAGDMSWAHHRDPEWLAFVGSNARGAARYLFGRVTYDMMAGFWPTPAAQMMNPDVVKAMNETPKFVASRSLERSAWSNSTVLQGELVPAVAALKASEGADLLIMGSGSVVAQLSEARLIDQYQLVLNPLALGGGRTLFQGMTAQLPLELRDSRVFRNGSVVLTYRLG